MDGGDRDRKGFLLIWAKRSRQVWKYESMEVEWVSYQWGIFGNYQGDFLFTNFFK
jgi:hypothetical protein